MHNLKVFALLFLLMVAGPAVPAQQQVPEHSISEGFRQFPDEGRLAPDHATQELLAENARLKRQVELLEKKVDLLEERLQTLEGSQ